MVTLNRAIKSLMTLEFKTKYSDKRFQDMKEYVKSTTKLHLWWHCFRPPLIISIVVLCIIATFRVAPPSEGFFANNGILPAIHLIGSGIATCTIVSVFKYFLRSNFQRRIGFPIAGALSFTGSTALLSNKACFPFPFAGVISLNVTAPLLIFLCYRFGLTGESKSLSSINSTLISIIGLWFTMTLYPGTIVLFHNYEYATYYTVFALFLMKRVYKKIIVHQCNNANITAPYISVMLANSFHIVYVSITLQQENSTQTVLTVMLFDVVSNFLSIWSLLKGNRPRNFDSEKSTMISKGKVQAVAPPNKTLEEENESQKSFFIISENFVLTEYLECITPLLMALINALLFYHPNGRFFSSVANMTKDELVSSTAGLVLYGVAEIASLQVLHLICRHRFQMSLWAQLGFILKKKWLDIGTFISTWILYSLVSSMEHTAGDWTFELKCNPVP